MQATGPSFEREAIRRLPELLADLLDDRGLELTPHRPALDRGADLLLLDSAGRRWVAEIKASVRPGIVAHAARQLRAFMSDAAADREAIPLLVVPYMSPASARTARDAGLNWVDLSGNASIRIPGHVVHVQGRPNAYRTRGRPSSPFAPRSSRVTRLLLLDPSRWWRQKDLAVATGLDDGAVSRAVHRLMDEQLIERNGAELRPLDPALLLDAWAEDYHPDKHDVVMGHISGGGMDGAREIARRLAANGTHHAFTGLPAAWAIDPFTTFRLITVYVDDDPHGVADDIHLRRETRGANVQFVSPNDVGVFAGEHVADGLPCVSAVQTYLDLLHLPERADEAARHLRAKHLWIRGTS